MRYITLKPREVVLTNLLGEPVTEVKDGPPVTYSFARFLLDRLADEAFAQSAADVLLAVAIRESINKAEETGELALEDAHYEKLKKVVEKPTRGYGQASVVHSFAPFLIQFLEHATKERQTEE